MARDLGLTFAEKRDIKGLIDLLFEIWVKWSPYGLIKIGVEKKAFDDQIIPLFEDEKRRRGVYPILEELKPMGRNKENRIKVRCKASMKWAK